MYSKSYTTRDLLSHSNSILKNTPLQACALCNKRLNRAQSASYKHSVLFNNLQQQKSLVVNMKGLVLFFTIVSELSNFTTIKMDLSQAARVEVTKRSAV